MKQDIVRKAVLLLGTNSALNSSNKGARAENLCEEFAASIIEDIVLSVKWDFALKRVDNIEGDASSFTAVKGVEDCLKPAIIVPS